MTIGEYFLYFSAGAFWGVILYANGKSLYKKYKIKKEMEKGNPKLNDLIQKLKEAAEGSGMKFQSVEIKNGKPTKTSSKPKTDLETHTLSWRHQGKLQHVKIVVDPSLDTVIDTSQEEFEQMVKSGDAGRLQDVLDGLVDKDAKDKLAVQDTFVFSKKSVEQMRMVDMSPDDIVTKILKASGRMD